jgi:nucleotide-binding universal stress UspA family protein
MLPIRIILHPTDFSEQSDYALRLACALARDHDARLVLLHVALPPMAVYGGDMLIPVPADSHDEERQRLDRLQVPEAVATERRLVEGDAATEILQLIQDTGADLVVMGTHGRTGLARFLMGSVAEQIVRKAPCPVLTVKTPFPAASPVPSAPLQETVDA